MEKLRRYWFPAGVALACGWGYFFPQAGVKLSAYLNWIVTLLMFLLGLGVGFPAIHSRMNRWREEMVVLIQGYAVAPAVAVFLSKWLAGGSPEIHCGLLLIGTTCTTLSSCVIYTNLAGGDDGLALWLSVVSSLLCAVLMPLLLLWLLPSQMFGVPVLWMIQRLLKVLLLPLSAGMLVRAMLGEKRVLPWGGILTRSCSLFVLSVIMVVVAKGRNMLVSGDSLLIFGMVAAFHLSMLLLAEVSGRLCRIETPARIAVLFCAAQKTVQIPAYLAILVLGMPGAAVPAVFYHVFQLVADAVIVSWFAGRE